MKFRDLKILKDLIFFTKRDLFSINPDIPKKTIDANIYEWTKTGKIIRLKRGLFILKKKLDYYSRDLKTKIQFKEFVASRLCYPSYLSEEYVLSKNEILSEGIAGISSVTLKKTAAFNNKLNVFVFRNIKRDLFLGYKSKYFLGEYEYFEATKAKALFDYLYRKSKTMSSKLKNRNLVSELRLNLDTFLEKDFLELREYSNKFGKIKLLKIINNIIKNASNY
ncbi:MAG: hypothetical protein GF335_01165 [Candidatus Moranbacteria bacterium]|nr:hypothetical protein [Candidatus Moranbacteria bacterium]